MKNYKKLVSIVWLPVFLSSIFSLFSIMTRWISERMDTFTFLSIFDNLQPIYMRLLPIFLAGVVAYKVSKKRDGAATLSGVISFLIVRSLISSSTLNLAFYYLGFKVDAALAYLNNPLIGIICGLIAATIYDRFHHVKLPDYLAFFSGKRFVPILISFVSILLSFPIACCFVFLFTMCKGIMQFLLDDYFIGISAGVTYDALLLPIGLKELFLKFYILPGMYDGIRLLFSYALPTLFLVLITRKEITNKYKGIFVLLLLTSIFTTNTIAVELFLFLLSPWLWLLHCCMIFVTTCILFYVPSSYFILIVIVMILYALCAFILHPTDDQFEFLDYSSISIHTVDQIMEDIGGEDNIIQIKNENEYISILLMNTEIVNKNKLCNYDELPCDILDDYLYVYAGDDCEFIYQEIVRRVNEDCFELEDLLDENIENI